MLLLVLGPILVLSEDHAREQGRTWDRSQYKEEHPRTGAGGLVGTFCSHSVRGNSPMWWPYSKYPSWPCSEYPAWPYSEYPAWPTAPYVMDPVERGDSLH